MIDKTLMVPPDGMLLFQTKQLFWVYVFPILMGFISVACIQIYSRVGVMVNIKMRTAFLFAAGSAMINVWGWMHMARTPVMVPFYGCGVGLASAVMSRMFAIIRKQRTRWKLLVPYVVWKGNLPEVEAVKQHMRMAA